ncbi:AAA family ATPase, partial [Candidatus Peregrinibacteria bacterium]|nr:AAA family ATPase [Candidatus Peregrinibacteria bacterium]
MIKRSLTSEIENSLQEFPAVGILGPRQVGKTTIAKIILSKNPKTSMYLDLELPSDLSKL